MNETKEYTFDLEECYSPDDIHSMLAQELQFPEYYGYNLDALYDVLTELPYDCRITFTGCDTASAVIGAKFMRNLERACNDASSYNDHLNIEFI